MNALDSPLVVFLAAESLLTVVNSIWTWIAVISAAALSLWRIRSSNHFLLSQLAPSTTPPAEPSQLAPSIAKKPAVESSPAQASFNSVGRTSGKFTVYYTGEAADNNNADKDGDVDPIISRSPDWEFEVSMKMRMWDDMGFRRYQDLTVLDGNVVRLWDGGNAVVVGGGGGYEYDWS